MTGAEQSLVVCDECGLAHRWPTLGNGMVARCSRCDAVIGRSHRLSIDSVLALTVAAAAAYLVAMSVPLLTLSLRGSAESATLVDAVVSAWRDGEPLIAIVAALTALVAPAAFIAVRLYLLFPLSAGIKPPGFAWCARVLHHADRWNMVEVFTVGVLLSLVRLAGLADASPGPGLYALGMLTLLFASIESAGVKHLWSQVP
jgi:paraquat-inducible protein A